MFRIVSSGSVIVAAVTCCMLATGCGSSDDKTSSSSPPPVAQPDDGCTDAEPNSVEPTNGFGAYVQVCYTEDGTRAQLENISDTWLAVTPESNSAVYYGTLKLGSPVSGPFSLAAHKSQELNSEDLLSFDLAVDWAATAHANVEQAVVSRLKSLGKGPLEKYANKVSSCAESAAQLTTQSQIFEQAVRNALEAQTCVGLLQDALRDAGQSPADERLVSEETRKALSLAEEIAGGTWKDEIVRLVSKLHAP
jgi:hypothetical protein